jgi:hypothetical protein
MTRNLFTRSLLIAIAAVIAPLTAAAQDDTQTRGILKSPDWKRPAASSRPAISRTYKLVRTERPPVKRPAPSPVKPPKGRPKNPKTQPKEPEKQVSELGLTIWRLRPPVANESGFIFNWERDDGPTEKLIAERVSSTATFRLGDKWRMAVESSEKGYLYVIDRETTASGRLGNPSLIFPEFRDENNEVGPGLLFDIPYALDENPWMKFVKRDSTPADWNGELFTIIISREKLPWLKLDDPSFLEDIENDSESEVFDRVDMDDRVFVNTEANASCGIATRGVEREKRSKTACGARARQLSRDEPQPQSVFRIRTTPGKPIVAFARIAVQQ